MQHDIFLLQILKNHIETITNYTILQDSVKATILADEGDEESEDLSQLTRTLKKKLMESRADITDEVRFNNFLTIAYTSFEPI